MDALRNRSEEEKQRNARRTQLQHEMLILDGQLKKIRIKHEGIGLELREINHQLKALELKRREVESGEKKLQNEERLLEQDISRLKKQINML